MKRIFIDPGHGGEDPGAIGPSGMLEKDIVLQIAELLDLACLRHGWDTEWSRRDDSRPRNSKRAELANEWNADVFISVHCNGADVASAEGHEVLCWGRSVKGQVLAAGIESALEEQFPSRRPRGVKPRLPGDRGATVLSQTRMPAVIVEPAFITNSYEEGFLSIFTNQAAIAWAITQGIKRAEAM